MLDITTQKFTLIFILGLTLLAVGCSSEPGNNENDDQINHRDTGDISQDTRTDEDSETGDPEEDSPFVFTASPGFGIEGPIEDGASITLTTSDDRFGTKVTDHPSLYDLVDRGSWIQGEQLFPYNDPELGDEVPVGDEYVFYTRGGTPRFYGGSDPIAPDRTQWYGGQFTEDGSGNITLRRPVRQFTAADETPEKPRINYYLSWFWRSSFVPGGDDDTGSSAKFIRIWDTEGGNADGYRVSWTRMHLTALRPGSDPYPSWSSVEPPVNEWAQFEFDSHTVDGGQIRAWVDGELLHEPTIPTVDEDWNGNISLNQWGYDPSVGISAPEHRFEITDLYADVSPARVVLANASAMDDATIRVPQMHLSWSPDTIELPDLYPGPLNTLEDAYVIIITEERDELLAGQLVARE